MSESQPAHLKFRRHPERGSYDREIIHAILDAGRYCHIGFIDAGRPFVIPTMYVRDRDFVYIHGSVGGRMRKTLITGGEICVTVTLIDGIIAYRAASRHSLNYRSAMIFGTAQEITDVERKTALMRLLVNKMIPGRWDEVRTPTTNEMAAVSVLRIPLDNASAKIRQGPPLELKEDLESEWWGGEIQLAEYVTDVIPDGHVAADVATAESVRALASKFRNPRPQ